MRHNQARSGTQFFRRGYHACHLSKGQQRRPSSLNACFPFCEGNTRYSCNWLMSDPIDPSQSPAAKPTPVPLPANLSKLARLAHPFPTRQFPYRRPGSGNGAALAQPPEFALPAGAICKFIFGRDPMPQVMSAEEIAANLNDSFATLLLRRNSLPLTMRSLMAELDSFNAETEGLPQQASFLVADGGQIPWSQ